ncbi:MAG: 50S ribosomal protein L29 [Cryomorphaceae bacterium]|nr:50S ribosomal protein L29 [Cryomorphaceae bacterium]
MKMSEVTQLSTKDLEDKVYEEKREINRLTMAHAISPLENPMVLRAKRRDVARMLTEIARRNREEHNKS